MGNIQLKSNKTLIIIMIIGLVITVFVLFLCRRKIKSEQVGVKRNNEKTEKSIFWEQVCSSNKNKSFFDCNSSENYYQVELLNDPFKDFVVIIIPNIDSLIDSVLVCRFKFTKTKLGIKDAELNNFSEFQALINPLNKDTMLYYYQSVTSVFKLSNDTIKDFFVNQIWNLPLIDEQIQELDGETWCIKGRKGGKHTCIYRRSFADSLFYSNIQNLLDYCNITDYQYKMR